MSTKPTWQQAEQLRDDPAVEDAITNFAHDQTGDNATGIVLAVLEHCYKAEAGARFALDEWLRKTEWVQDSADTFPGRTLGLHRADVMRNEVIRLRAAQGPLANALARMVAMHSLMMKKVNHRASFYDGECLREMNEAPLQAQEALRAAGVVK